ncbi:MAG: hypothetical protein WD275_05545 [Rhodothermales bacterium]
MADYSIVGKRVRVHLYDRMGQVLGVIIGRVADVASDVPVGKDAAGKEIRKDLAYVVDIESGDPEVPYRNSAGDRNEGWFAVQDIQVIEERLTGYISMN